MLFLVIIEDQKFTLIRILNNLMGKLAAKIRETPANNFGNLKYSNLWLDIWEPSNEHKMLEAVYFVDHLCYTT